MLEASTDHCNMYFEVHTFLRNFYPTVSPSEISCCVVNLNILGLKGTGSAFTRYFNHMFGSAMPLWLPYTNQAGTFHDISCTLCFCDGSLDAWIGYYIHFCSLYSVALCNLIFMHIGTHQIIYKLFF